MLVDLNRRGFFKGLGASLIVAPAIVKISSLMPIKGDKATYHFIDNQAIAIRFTGKILIDLINYQYDDLFLVSKLRIRLPNDYRVI